MVIYLDDLLILHQNTAELQKIFQLVTNLLMDLGFIMKREKCSPSPTQTIVFLGAYLDSFISWPLQFLRTNSTTYRQSARNL